MTSGHRAIDEAARRGLDGDRLGYFLTVVEECAEGQGGTGVLREQAERVTAREIDRVMSCSRSKFLEICSIRASSTALLSAIDHHYQSYDHRILRTLQVS